jgi:hypothetical protein
MFYALAIIALCAIILDILIDLCEETVQKVVKKKEESGHTGTNFAKLMVVCGYIIIIGAVIVLALGGIIYILTN